MADYIKIEKRIAKGRGKAAKRLGQPMIRSRLTSAGFVVRDKPLKCFLRRLNGGKNVEQRFFPSQVFEAVIDGREVEVGDLLEELSSARYAQQRSSRNVDDRDSVVSNVGIVQQAYAPIYYIAQKRPIHKYIMMRMEALCQIRRPVYSTTDGDGGQQEEGENAETVLVLPTGQGTFTFVPTLDADLASTLNEDEEEVPPVLVPALIPFQLEIAFIQGRPPFDLPTDMIVGKWHFACPNDAAGWKGLILKEGDQIINPRGDRLRIHALHEGAIGVQVQQGLAERLES